MKNPSVVVVSGNSGVGKTSACWRAGVNALPLDSFYRSASPEFPKWLSRIDWDDIATYDLSLAVTAVERLLADGFVNIPSYDLTTDQQTGEATFRITDRVLVAEGVFGPEVVRALAERGYIVAHYLIVRNRVLVAFSRITRDVGEGRLPPWFAIARSLQLAFGEVAYRRRAVSALAMPVSPEATTAAIRHYEDEEDKVTPLESLRKDIGRALIQAQFSRIGRDFTHQQKASADAQHLLVPHSEQLPSELIDEMDRVTGGIVGLVLDPPQYRGTITHLRELPDDWEERVNRSILESFVLYLASACEWFIDEATRGIKGSAQFIDSFPQHAQALKELRASRNCLLHNAGVVDSKYVQQAGTARRANDGEILPLDWGYAYSSTVLVLLFGQDVAAGPTPSRNRGS